MAVRAVARRPLPTRRRDGLTPAKFAEADRVQRARPASASHDAEVYSRAADLAREHGVDPSAVFDELEDRAAARMLADNVSPLQAQRLAFLDVLERYERTRRNG